MRRPGPQVGAGGRRPWGGPQGGLRRARNPCTTDSCTAGGGCANLPAENGSACADGLACTTGDTCQGGACTPASTACGPAPSAWPLYGHDAQHSGRAQVSGAQTTNIQWKFQVGGAINGSAAAVGTDGTIYLGAMDKSLYAIEKDGTVAWTFPTQGEIQSSPAVGAEGSVYFGSNDGNVYATWKDGTPRWTFPTGDDVRSPPVLDANGTVYVGSNDGSVYAIAPDGSKKWSYPFAATAACATGVCPVRGAAALAPDGTVVAGSFSGQVVGLSPSKGEVVWTFNATGAVVGTPAIAEDGSVHFGTLTSNVYGLDAAGASFWPPVSAESAIGSFAFADDGSVLFGQLGDFTKAYAPSGDFIWEASGGAVGPVIGADGLLYVGTKDANVNALNPDGTQKWAVYIGGGAGPDEDDVTSIAIVAEGRLVVALKNGKVLAIGP